MKQLNHFLILICFTTLGVVLGVSLESGLWSAQMPPSTNRMQVDHAPTPYSAAQISTGCPRGRKIVFQVEMMGKPMLFRTTTFGSNDEVGVVLTNVTTGMDGKKVGTTQMVVAKWDELQAHASFPAADTRIESATYETPAGTFDCLLYTVAGGADRNVKRLWFAADLPGPPVCYEETRDGKIVYRLTMLKTGK